MFDLEAFASKTLLDPTAHVGIDVWPDVAIGDELLGCSNTPVCESANHRRLQNGMLQEQKA